MGAISVLTGGPLGVRMQAETDCRVAMVDADDFQRLAFAQPAVHKRVMERVAPVMSRITATEQNRERLASLGTMAAGLAHELNNPAAAARSAAGQLAEALDVVGSTIDRFVHSGVEREQAERLLELHRQAVEAAEGHEEPEGLAASDAEDELLERLEELGVPEPWRLVAPLVAAGVEREWLDQVAELAGPATGAAVAWLAATLTARGLVDELRESTSRMVDLVGAVKTYAYMDRGELVEVDVHEGIKMTLKVLGHRLKHTGIQIEKDLDRDLPKLTVRGSELNQVWTNLLDNAIDALGRERDDHDLHAPRRGLRGDRDRRRRPRNRARGPRAGVRLVLHHQGGGARHRAGAGHRLAHRGGPPLGHAHARLPARPDRVRGPAPTRPALNGGRRWPPAPTSTRSRSPSCPRRWTAARNAWPAAASGFTCGSASPAGTWAAATPRPASTPRGTQGTADHPIMRSLEPGEQWSWCFEDELGMIIREVQGQTRIPPSPLA